MKRALVAFCRPAIPGKVKTRLAQTIGHKAASDVYALMLSHAADKYSHVNADLRVFVSEEPEEIKLPWPITALQEGADLGERMSNAFLQSFSQGYDQVLLCGTDIPSLTAEIISECFDALGSWGMVIGPTTDGGYYLIGLTRAAFDSSLFTGIPWSTPSVFTDTTTAAQRLKLRTHVGPLLTDLDTLDDAMQIVRQCPGPFADRLLEILADYAFTECREDPLSP
jgi:uncharacterized protein